MTLKLYVPKAGTNAFNTIKRGSAIVGRLIGTSSYARVDYEGNLYQAENLKDFTARVLHAAGRHVRRYPTRARMMVKEEDLIEVGEVSGDGVVLSITNQAALDEWVEH